MSQSHRMAKKDDSGSQNEPRTGEVGCVHQDDGTDGINL